MKSKGIKKVITIIALVLMLVITMQSGQEILPASAETSARITYEESNVWDDLQGATIGGNVFDIKDYPHNETGEPQVISFIEFGYSYSASKQEDYGLYAYVYNPRDLAFETGSGRNKIQFRCGNKSYNPSLKFLNYSNAVGFEGRFYKFKVDLTDKQRSEILKEFNSGMRVYEISGITLAYGSAAEYTVAQKYTYTGFAKGYGTELTENETLSCKVDGFDRYVDLDVKHTEYRPKGDYYNGEQSQLNSVYFRIPERFFTDYGELTEIACEWYEYFTKPLLVSNDKQTVDAINSLYGRRTRELPTDEYYLFQVYWQNITDGFFTKEFKGGWTSNRDYFGDWYRFGFLWLEGINYEEPDFGGFAGAFYSDKMDRGSVENAVSGDEVLELLRQHSERLGGIKIQGKYSEALFEDFVQNGYTRGYNKKTITKDEQMKIFWNTLKVKTAWQKMFSSSINVDTEYEALNAIQVIEEKDLNGADSEISKTLRINVSDVSSFKTEYAKAKLKNERLVLFRFSTTKYLSAPSVSAHCKGTEINSGTSDGEILAKACHSLAKKGDWNCYTAQETVYLDFDIITLTYTSDDVETGIPVVMTPVEITGGLTPPLVDPNNPTEKESFWDRVGQFFENLWNKIKGFEW